MEAEEQSTTVTAVTDRGTQTIIPKRVSPSIGLYMHVNHSRGIVIVVLIFRNSGKHLYSPFLC